MRDRTRLGNLADFRRLAAAAATRGMKVALDFAVQCAPDHPWVREHPQWFRFRPDGSIKYAENPPKKYEDIVNFDFETGTATPYGRHCATRAVLGWSGVDIFRVDNPHTKPLPFWEWLIREVKARCPEANFRRSLHPAKDDAGLGQGRVQPVLYLFYLAQHQGGIDRIPDRVGAISGKGIFPSNFFTNTPDILPEFLQEGGRPAFLIRLVLAATLSPAYGIYNGFELCENTAIPDREEYLNSEKYEYKTWDWDRPGNIKTDIRIINHFRRANPAMQEFANLRFLACDAAETSPTLKYRLTRRMPSLSSSISTRMPRMKPRSNCRWRGCRWRLRTNLHWKRHSPAMYPVFTARGSAFVSTPKPTRH